MNFLSIENEKNRQTEIKTTWNVLYSNLDISMFALDINNLDVSGSYTDTLFLSKTQREKCVELISRQPKDLLNVVGLWAVRREAVLK